MQKEFELLETDWITAQMYGKYLKKRQNDIPFSKNGIEPYGNFDSDIEDILDMIDHTLFAPSKDKFRTDKSWLE